MKKTGWRREYRLPLRKKLNYSAPTNYRSVPDWHRAVRDATNGRGADLVVETAGTTLQQSLEATAFGGFVAVVGFLAGYETKIQLRQLIGPMIRVQGIAIGSRARFEAMNRAIAVNNIRPVIDSSWTLSDAPDAFRRMKAGAHFGKIVVAI